jgi:hypothetical protein
MPFIGIGRKGLEWIFGKMAVESPHLFPNAPSRASHPRGRFQKNAAPLSPSWRAARQEKNAQGL